MKKPTMHTIIQAPRQLKLFGALLAMAALLLAVVFTAGSTQAQSETYADPHPCGPGFDEFYKLPDFPVNQVDAGHFAVFDAYYDLDADKPHRPTEDREAWAGLMSLNFCPPELKDDAFSIPPFARLKADIDIGKTVFHVNQAAHALTAADVEAYDFFKLDEEDNDPDTQDSAVGQDVYWLRVGDDRNTGNVREQASDFQISFSTALFDADYWYREDDNDNSIEPFWYEIEAERELGIHPREYGHFYIFDDSDEGADKKAICNSRLSETCVIPMEPGQYRKLQWAFTKTGTYELSVHLNGHVRKAPPPGHPEGENWNPASDEEIVTSQVKQYTFHVGPLTLNQQPMFRGPVLSVPENSGEGTVVTGSPVPVVGADDTDTLTYELSGVGHSNFVAESVAGGAQIKVAPNPYLDTEVRRYYDLVLSVSDGKNRADDHDETVDHTIALRIEATDVDDGPGPSVSLSVNRDQEDASQEVQFTAHPHHLPSGHSTPTYTLWRLDDQGDRVPVETTFSTSGASPVATVPGPGVGGTINYQVEIKFDVNGHVVKLYSDPVPVRWIVV